MGFEAMCLRRNILRGLHTVRYAEFYRAMVVVNVVVPRCKCLSGMQSELLQSRTPQQIEVFQPFQHTCPFIPQRPVEFDFADVWTTKPS